MSQANNSAATPFRRWPGKPLKGEGFELRAKQMIRNELVRSGLNHEQLVERLASMGVTDNVPNLRNKITRGRFTASFLLQVMVALGAKTIDLDSTLVDLAKRS